MADLMDDTDPAAEFLAQEQTSLAGIAAETLGLNPTETDTGLSAPPGGGDMFGLTTSEPAQPPEPQDRYSAISFMESEPECIRQWREEQQKLLAEKDQAEKEALQELRAIAEKELQEWYAHYNDQLAKTKSTNREAQEVYVEERDSDAAGDEWERVSRLCDFNPKNNKNTKDVSRMRSIFLQLKQTPLVR